MGQIRVLPLGLVNRIAAGECVERPASVVKELVENSLDAGASRLDVTILDGGRGLIQVVDDGAGMDADDLMLSVRPHATSKIQSDEDLYNIHTMGFRGEALASIGAVARLQIRSRRRESEVGYTIRVEAGEVMDSGPCSGPVGTTVEVRDLFYCVPARRKFLRTNQTEMGHVTEQFARLALAHPGIAFSLRHQNREMHRLEAAQDRRRRIADFYGTELSEVLLPVRRAGEGVLVEGYVAPPAHCRRSGKWEYVFVNGRYVRDRFVSHAVKAAYRSLIKPDEHPVVFLFITIEPTQVDVNVHPTKVEVRWRDSNYVHAQVLAAVRDKFLSTNLDRALQPPVRDEEAYRQRVREAMVDFFTKSRPGQAESPGAGAGARGEAAGGGRSNAEGPREDAGLLSAAPWEVSGGSSREAGEPGSGGVPAARVGPGERAPGLATGGGAVEAQELPGDGSLPSEWGAGLQAAGPAGDRRRAIQVHNTYLVAETDEGLVIIDQHALHERVLYEELRRRIADKPLESQRLLLPDVIRVPPDRLGALETHAETLERLGIELTVASPQAVALRAFPLLMERVEPTGFVRDLLDLLSERGQRPNTESLVHDVLDMMACKAAVKAGDALAPAEIEALLARREIAERVSHCPHGRPTTLRLSLRDLERQFKRH